MTSSGTYPFLRGGGKMGELTREFDWHNTSLGPPSTWPQSLRTTLGLILHSAFPMFLFWGEDLICFYNDAFRPSLGADADGKHPAVGKKGKEVWSDIWDFIKPLIDKVMKEESPVFFENQLVPFYRNGKTEDIFWTFSYSPAYGDEGEINGVFVTCTETTEYVKTVQRHKQSVNRYHSLIAEATIGIVVLVGENNVVEIVNDAYAKIIHSGREEVTGRPIFEVIPETASYFEDIINNVRKKGVPYYQNDHPYFIETDTGKMEGYLNLVYQPYRDEDGTISGVMVLCQDVTEQVITRKKIETSEFLVRSIVESAPFPIAVYLGKEMRIELANQAIIDTWGKGSNVIGKTYYELLPEVSDYIYAQLDNVFETGIPYNARNQRVDLVMNGTLEQFYFNYSFTPLFDANGKIYGVMNTAADVTDLKLAMEAIEQSEKNIYTMIMQAPVAMCILTGPDHVIDVTNDAMVELWGKQRQDVMSKPVFEALPDAKEQGLEELLARVYRTGEVFRAQERPVVLERNGRLETVYQNFVYQPYLDVEGNNRGILAISIDVTAQVTARQRIEELVADRTRELANTNAELQRSNAELAQFAYIASHDLQEPVRKVSTFAQMLETSLGTIDDRSKNYLNKIKNSAAKMHVLIKDVLAYSELSNISASAVRIDLQKVIDEVLADFELIIERKNASFAIGSLPAIVGIPLQISQLFGNLISNALKFSKKDLNPLITIDSQVAVDGEFVRYTTLDKSKSYYKITVADNGIGFSPVYAGKIFSIFQRLHGKSEFEGTGIGLAMCQKIVQNHGGIIEALSEEGQGATFTLFLPMSSQVPQSLNPGLTTIDNRILNDD